jgi:hypothetical protein
MRNCPERLPWQHVVGKKDARRAQIVLGEDDHGNLQRMLLEAERMTFDENGFIPLRDFGWQPEQLAVRQPRSRKKAASPTRKATPRPRAKKAAPLKRARRLLIAGAPATWWPSSFVAPFRSRGLRHSGGCVLSGQRSSGKRGKAVCKIAVILARAVGTSR